MHNANLMFRVSLSSLALSLSLSRSLLPSQPFFIPQLLFTISIHPSSHSRQCPETPDCRAFSHRRKTSWNLNLANPLHSARLALCATDPFNFYSCLRHCCLTLSVAESVSSEKPFDLRCRQSKQVRVDEIACLRTLVPG